MNNRKAVNLLFIISALVFASCSTEETSIRKNYPPGIVLEICTEGDELSPRQPPCKDSLKTYCSDDSRVISPDKNEGVYPSYKYIADIFNSMIPADKRDSSVFNFDYYVRQNAETITFLTDSSGFFSIAHLPDRLSSELLDLGFIVSDDSSSGGTDIYEFYTENGKYRIKRVGGGINSVFWDSHPYALSDSSGNVLLLWSTDRRSPYSFIINTDGTRSKYGNTDIYYSFRHPGGSWSKPAPLDALNTQDNEETPFVYCQCYNTLLFFASNRNGAGATPEERYNDYDIYSAGINIDFSARTVGFPKDMVPRLLPKGENLINTNSRDFFPFISRPYSDAPPENYMYLASDRYSKDEKGIVFLNEGKLDIYRFPVDSIGCRAPKIIYRFVIVDSLHPGDEVRSPLCRIYETDADGKKKLFRELHESSGSVEIQPWQKYYIEGGSLYDSILCRPDIDSALWHYQIRAVNLVRTDTIGKTNVIEYNKLKTKEIVRYRDTAYSLKCTGAELARLKASKTRNIISAIRKGDLYETEVVEKIKFSELVPVDTIRQTDRIFVKELSYVFDTAWSKSTASNLNPSVLTHRSGTVFSPNSNDEVIIDDTIYVWSRYFTYPPCVWKYTRHETDYRRNVPYFQTCFWEVNTGANLSKHLSEFQQKGHKYSKASFLELNPHNYYFGYMTGISSLKYQSRVNKYRDFARAVDDNLSDMAEEIGGAILPQLMIYDSIAWYTNKLVIMIDAYSDLRPIEGTQARFISRDGNPVSYLAVTYDTASLSVSRIYNVNIPNETSLLGENNDVLSKLRVYYGYREVLKKLRNYPAFADYEKQGLVLLPDEVTSEKEFWERFDRCKIIFCIEGKQRDLTVKPTIEGYVGRQGDFASLDTVRRINLVVQRVVADGRSLSRPDCCRKTPVTPVFLKPEDGEEKKQDE